MRISRSTLSGFALVLLAAGVGALILAALANGRSPAVGVSSVVLASPSAAARPRAAPTAVQALLIGDGVTSLGSAIQATTRWRVTVADASGAGFVTGQVDTRLAPRLTNALRNRQYDVVVLAATAFDGEQVDARVFGASVQAAVAQVRQALPGAAIVLLGPAAPTPGAFATQRTVLSGVAARFGAFYLDPVGRGWLAGPGLVQPGTVVLTAAGTTEIARRFTGDLRPVFPRTLLPAA